MSRICVTGASGFIGRNLIGAIGAAGHEPLPLSVRDALKYGKVRIPPHTSTLIHLAGRAHRSDNEAGADELYSRDNIELTRLTALSARIAGVKRFVYVSSAGVLGWRSPDSGFSESSVPHPYNAYTRSKLLAEEVVRGCEGFGLSAVIVRPPLVYGPLAPGNFGRLIGMAKNGSMAPVGGFTEKRSILGVRNLCDLLMRVSNDVDAEGITTLVSDRGVTTVRDLVENMIEIGGFRTRLASIPAPLITAALSIIGRGTDARRLAAPFFFSSTNASDILKWVPPFTLREELEWALEREVERQ